ncbi:MAG: dephospho-CoA kinase, partial [Acidimicrobiales bacterium]
MITIGLTGGIGSGKSSVGSLLVERGAELIDADVLARAVVEPGQRAWAAVRERFGSLVIAADGRVDRAALADIVFSDEVARADLNAIVHPEVARAMLERVGEIALLGGDQVVVLDVPLLVEAGGPDRYGVAGVLV